MIPLRDDNPTVLWPIFTAAFILANIAVFGYQWSLLSADERLAEKFIFQLGMIPAAIADGPVLRAGEILNDRNSLLRAGGSEIKFPARYADRAPVMISDRPPNRPHAASVFFSGRRVSDKVALSQLGAGFRTGLDIAQQPRIKRGSNNLGVRGVKSNLFFASLRRRLSFFPET